MRFQNKLATFKNKCEKLITKSYENSKIHVKNLKKEIRREDNIIEQVLLGLQKISTQRTRHLVDHKVSVDHHGLASMEYNIKHPNNSQINEPETEPSNTETRVNITKKKGHIDQQIKEVYKQYD